MVRVSELHGVSNIIQVIDLDQILHSVMQRCISDASCIRKWADAEGDSLVKSIRSRIDNAKMDRSDIKAVFKAVLNGGTGRPGKPHTMDKFRECLVALAILYRKDNDDLAINVEDELDELKRQE